MLVNKAPHGLNNRARDNDHDQTAFHQVGDRRSSAGRAANAMGPRQTSCRLYRQARDPNRGAQVGLTAAAVPPYTNQIVANYWPQMGTIPDQARHWCAFRN